MHVFSSSVLGTIFAILASSFAAPTPIPQDADVCLGGVGVTLDRPIDTIEYPFNIRVIGNTGPPPSSNLGFVRINGALVLAMGELLSFTLTDNALATTDERFVASGVLVDAPTRQLSFSSGPSLLQFAQVQRCVGNTPVTILEPYGGSSRIVLSARKIGAGNFVQVSDAGRVPPGLEEVLFQVVPI